jgi:hypothetical protein
MPVHLQVKAFGKLKHTAIAFGGGVLRRFRTSSRCDQGSDCCERGKRKENEFGCPSDPQRWRCHEVTNGPWYELFRKREAQYGRLVHNVLNMLNDAVHHRISEGETKASIARIIGCDRSSLSRILNGNIRNLTLRTISDILWATNYEPQDFSADPVEVISPNYVSIDVDQVEAFPHPSSSVGFYISDLPVGYIKTHSSSGYADVRASI